ncbi:hypothetical protein N836_01825 [Leptolyngbya sp. Heron Island J]|uniref:hypothetical protein n=1 Tax=Leptolyngbya sp. Heron Island J TaxID=1385935 RepID=UPI0003B9D275|nr:hypothetical protein [Leptolyngbya sp. Heron Island J]ESA33531.1 hypothetical protein N836_01825 [Leptolyngbya sp. Heron Island J]
MSTSNPQPLRSVGLPDIEQILGLAVFDAVGLPRDYFITSQHEDIDWVKLVFQSLGLQQLMVSTMGLPDLNHAMIRTKVGNIVIICCESQYIALLLKRALPQEQPQIDNTWVDWVCEIETKVVRTHPHFRAV